MTYPNMKTIGTCKECKWWADCSKTDPEIYNTQDWGMCEKSKYNMSLGKTTQADFGCIHWEDKSYALPPMLSLEWQAALKEDRKHNALKFEAMFFRDNLEIAREMNYPSRTPQDLEIADLKRENNAAFELIQELSAALVALGYDPTSKKP